MRESTPMVAVVVLNWNRFADSRECLASLAESVYGNLVTILVDNGSTDGSAEALSQSFPDCTILRNSSNLGYAEGNNVGIRHAIALGADFVMVLNNDTRIDPEAVSRLVAVAEGDPSIGVLGPRIYLWDRPEVIWFDGAVVDPVTVEPRHQGLWKEEGDRPAESVETGYISGCALMVRSRLLREVGLFDPDYFLVFEEADLCRRILDRGWRAVVVPGAKVWHKVSVSFGGGESATYLYYFHRNNLLYVHKRLRGYQRWRGYFHVLKRQAHYVWHLHRNRRSDARAHSKTVARALRDFLLHRWGEADRH